MEFMSSELYQLINLHPSDRPQWLVGANLVGAKLARAKLSKANLRDAMVMEGQLAEAKSLEGAILPNGTVHL